jgi:GDPmannose 4,6-dehydratase
MKQALITGITGQDGAHLSKLLPENGYRVFGLNRRTSTPTTERLQYLDVLDRITLLDGDVTDQGR